MILGRSVRGGDLRPLYDLLYSADWGEITTNDYGFAPAQIEGPERYQLQMYEELYRLFRAQWDPSEPQRLLEVSSGRGGGLRHLVKRWESEVHAVGLDLSARAVEFCGRHHADVGTMAFAQGSALSLPFKDGSFDVVVNVEASHGYGDDEGFFREVWRVLRSGGAFLYADSRMRQHVPRAMQLLSKIGFKGNFQDITSNVARACELDSERRRALIRSGVPWPYRVLMRRRLDSYAGIAGSATYQKFRTHRREYFMACMMKVLRGHHLEPSRINDTVGRVADSVVANREAGAKLSANP
jgi:ubiquinone/menaquinone biosynthesis C-methylase UbiE